MEKHWLLQVWKNKNQKLKFIHEITKILRKRISVSFKNTTTLLVLNCVTVRLPYLSASLSLVVHVHGRQQKHKGGGGRELFFITWQ
jgi:hypothetical protein